MSKSIVFAVALCLLAAISYADDTITIFNLKPVDGALVNECPTFSWSKRAGIKDYIITIKKKNGATRTETVHRNIYAIDPYKMANFLTVGEYTWFVQTKDGSEKSNTQSFSIPVLSCIPPKVDNKVDNTFGTFSQTESHTPAGSSVTPWKTDESEIFNISDIPIKLFPPEGGKIYALKLHETYLSAGGNPQDEAEQGIGVQEIVPDIGDDYVAFRYLYYTTGNSTVHVELKDSGGNIEYLGCIGWTKDPKYNVECEPDTHDKNLTIHYNPGMALKTGNQPTPKWDLFKKKLSSPKTSDDVLYLRFRYERAVRQKEDNFPKDVANYLFFMSEVVFGQCSSIPLSFYDQTSTNGNCKEDCPECASAGLYCPKSYKDANHCLSCKSQQDDPGVCATSDYCTRCDSSGTCDDTPVSQCREAAACSGKGKKDCQAADDCSWCDLDSKCVFLSDEFSEDVGCSTCGSFKDKDSCNSKSACGWCPTLHFCLVKGSETCPSCGLISEDSCTLEDTDNECEYCHAQGKCLSAKDVCDATCGDAASESACTGEDCHWCVSTRNCTEKRVACHNCSSFKPSECVASKYPGCYLCDTQFCTDDAKHCPVCEERSRENCAYEGSVELNCQFCNSTLKCMSKKDECVKCASVVNASACTSYAGCSYCKSEQSCRSSDDTLTDCDCFGLGATSCAAHSKGCCWSSATTKCYDVGDENCKSGPDTTIIIIVCVVVGIIIAALAIVIPILVCCCKPKSKEDIEMTQPGTIVVLPEGQPSMVVAQESLQSVNVDPATAVSVEETSAANLGMAPSNSAADMQNMQNMLAQQQMLNTMMAQQQMSMMMNPMMMNSMNMMNMSGMAGMSGMNSMGMDMNSMNMTGGMNSLNMTGGMNSMQNNAVAGSQGQM